jgi:hypothetical protein
MDLLDLAKTGIAALSTYASYKDQKKKNELQQQSYDDYMKQVADATQAAEASIAANLTPMVVSGTPTTKADVTDYTAATGLRHGGISGLRKGYARGPEIEEVEMMDEEVVTPFDLKMEEGVNIGEQVFYNTGDDRRNALMVWDAMSTPDKSIFDFDFEIFFQDGGWRDMIKGEAPNVQGDRMMASAPSMGDSQNEMSMQLFNKPYNQLNEIELEMFQEEMLRLQNKFMATGGIAGLRHGGRPGYRYGNEVIADQETILKTPNEEIVTNDMEEIKGQTADMKDMYQSMAEQIADEDFGQEFYDLSTSQQNKVYRKAIQRINDMFADKADMMRKNEAQGGRIGYRYGDQVGITAIPRPVMDPRGLRSLPAMATKDGMLDLGGLEKDYRFDGGFVPIGAYEKKDDVPARLSKNEFVFTADAVRAAGGGSINKGAKRMYETMKNLEAKPEAKRMTA